MYVTDVVPADVPAKLPYRLNEGDDLDVADGPPDFDDHDVDVLVGEALDPVLDLVGDVRDDLHRATEEVAATLLGDHRAVDATGRGVGAPGQVLVDEALVVPEVEVGLAAVLGDEDLAVLARVHGAGVDVDVGVEFAHGDPEATAFEESAERGGGEALAERARDTPGDEDELVHATHWAPKVTTYDRCTGPR